MSLLSLDSTTRKFYIGCYLSEEPPNDRSYHLPVRNLPGQGSDFVNLESLIETSNPEELMAPPEDFELPIEDVQSGFERWTIEFAVGERNFSNDTEFTDSLFYAFYLGPFGLVKSDFYAVIGSTTTFDTDTQFKDSLFYGFYYSPGISVPGEFYINFSIGGVDYGNDTQFLDSLFYAFYLGARQTSIRREPLPIAVPDFYTIPLDNC